MSYRKGSKVWVEEKGEGWVEAEVTEAKERAVLVLTSQRKKITVSPEKLLPRDTDEDLGGGHVDDMTKLTYLNEPGVLYNLKKRYALNEIYVSGLPALFYLYYCNFHLNLIEMSVNCLPRN